jgi:hypothetical protein
MSARTPGAERLHQARRAAAKELSVKANDPRAIRLATLQCAHDSAQAQLAGGRTVDIDSLLKLDAALAQARAAATSAPSLNVQFCRRLYGVCQKCGHVQELDEELPPLPEPPRAQPDTKPDAPARGATSSS